MNTKTVFAPMAESEDICFAPPLLTLVPQRDCPLQGPARQTSPADQTPVAGIPLR